MKTLEEETLSEGFLVCLLSVTEAPAQNAVCYRAVLFSGGREQSRQEVTRERNFPPEIYLQLRKFLAQVVAPPHILAGTGRGWQRLMAEALSGYLNEFRVLDLMRAASALKGLPGGGGHATLARAYQIRRNDTEAALDVSWHDDLLWAAVAEASRQGLDWPGFMNVMERGKEAPPFENYAFSEESLAELPQAPGVYIMRDRDQNVLYVGKAANLAGRVRGYFRVARDLPEKLRELRTRIHTLEVRLVGSELEALLLERQLIAEMAPAVNVQRRVAEGRSRYPRRFVPTVLFGRSVRPGWISAFFFGRDHHALQLQFNPLLAPPPQLPRIVDYWTASSRKPRRSKVLTDWGTLGGELCHRYFAHARDHLQWLELDVTRGRDDLVVHIVAAARTVTEREPGPGEFRFSETWDAP